MIGISNKPAIFWFILWLESFITLEGWRRRRLTHSRTRRGFMLVAGLALVVLTAFMWGQFYKLPSGG